MDRTSKGAAVVATLVLTSAAVAQFELPKINIPVPKFVTPEPKASEKGPQTCECPKFDNVKAQQQENVWCWAACAEMIYKYHGKKITQKEIAERIHGHDEAGEAKVKAASVYEILVALAGAEGKADRTDRFVDRFEKESAKSKNGVTVDVGTYINGWIEEDTVNSDELINEIKIRQPVVIGMSHDERFKGGHAMVVYGVTYKLAERNMLERAVSGDDGTVVSRMSGIRKFEITTLKVMDPWTGEPREITGKEFKEGCDFMMSQHRAVAVLKKEDEAVKAR